MPVGVDDDILAGRGEGNDDGEHGCPDRRFRRAGSGKGENGPHQGDLGNDRPCPAAAQPCRKKGDVEPVDQRRPQELEGIGGADQGKRTDGRQRYALHLEPERQCREDQQQRQPAGKTQEQNGDDAPVEIDPAGGEPVLGVRVHPAKLASVRLTISFGSRRARRGNMSFSGGAGEFGQRRFRPGAEMADDLRRGDTAQTAAGGEALPPLYSRGESRRHTNHRRRWCRQPARRLRHRAHEPRRRRRSPSPFRPG